MARFLQVPVWCLNRIPVHYLQEAEIILKAKYGARMMALKNKDVKLMPVWPIEPYEM